MTQPPDDRPGPLAGFPVIPALLIICLAFSAAMASAGPCGAAAVVIVLVIVFDRLYRRS